MARKLAFLLIENNLENIYYPNIEIRHLEDVATNMTYKREDERQKFLNKRHKEALEILIKDMEKRGFT